MQRARQTKLNIAIALFHQVVTAVSGLILPRFMMLYYGSEANGLIQSIVQILKYTTLLECGIGGMVLAAMYKPLADNDMPVLSGIFNGTKKFFDRISLVFVGFALLMCVGVKLIVSTEFDFVYTAALVAVLALDTYFNYYFGITHILLLKADHKLYIVQTVQIITIILNLIISVVIMKLDGPLHIVKGASAFVFLINAITWRYYVKHHYRIDRNEKATALPEKKNGIIHHLSYFIHRNTDIVIVSAVLGVINASIYSVYNAVILVIENLLISISSGVSGAIGNMLAKEENDTLENSFNIYEAVNTFMTMAISTVAAILIIPFVKIYTNGVTDAVYEQPVFAYIMIAAAIMYCIRIPYGMVVNSAGHYKQTRTGAIFEAVINLVLSLVLVNLWGLSGVAFGTFAAMTYRTFYTVVYLSRNILNRPSRHFIISLTVNLLACIACVWASGKYIISADSLFELIIEGIKVSAIVIPLFAVVNLFLINKKIFKINRRNLL